MDADLVFGPSDRSRGPAAGISLSSRVAAALQDKIRSGTLPEGARLPTENALAQHFGVSRTVIREAIAALKAEGLVETRQGSGAFLRRPEPARSDAAFRIDPLTREAVGNLLQLIEVRRVIEAEIAALAATQRSAAQLRTAVTVTRANEARRRDFADQVRNEHARILAAITAGDPEAAREAAAEHMAQAAARVIAADQDFWTREGGEYARRLAAGEVIPGAGSPDSGGPKSPLLHRGRGRGPAQRGG